MLLEPGVERGVEPGQLGGDLRPAQRLGDPDGDAYQLASVEATVNEPLVQVLLWVAIVLGLLAIVAAI